METGGYPSFMSWYCRSTDFSIKKNQQRLEMVGGSTVATSMARKQQESTCFCCKNQLQPSNQPNVKYNAGPKNAETQGEVSYIFFFQVVHRLKIFIHTTVLSEVQTVGLAIHITLLRIQKENVSINNLTQSLKILILAGKLESKIHEKELTCKIKITYILG